MPNSVLSTDAGVVRVTAPGRKECEGVADSPGDGLPLTARAPRLHADQPAPDRLPAAGHRHGLAARRPAGDHHLGRHATTCSARSTCSSNVTGDDRARRRCTYQADRQRAARSRWASSTSTASSTCRRSTRLTELNDTNGDEVTDEYRTVATWPFGGNFHEFAFGLLYQDGFFYLNLSVVDQLRRRDHRPAARAQPRHHHQGQQEHRRGAPTSPAACAPRTASAGARRAASSSPTTRAAGCRRRSWCTSSRTGSSTTTPTRPARSTASPVTQPVLWLPQNEIANSPSTPVLLTDGPVRRADADRRRHLRRPAARRTWRRSTASTRARCSGITQGLEAGVIRGQPRPGRRDLRRRPRRRRQLGPGRASSTYGLQKLTPNGTNAFDILAMRAIAERLRDRVHPAAVGRDRRANAGDASTRSSSGATCRPPSYGGPKVDEQTLTGHLGDRCPPTGKKVTLHDRRPAGRAAWCTCARRARSPRPPASRCGAPRPGTRSTRWSGRAAKTAARWHHRRRRSKCLDVSNGGTADGTKIQLWTCNGTAAQQWTTSGDGTLRALGKCLDVNNSGTANGTDDPAVDLQRHRRAGLEPQATARWATRSRAGAWRPPAAARPTAPRSTSGTYAGGAHQKWVVSSGVTG